MRKSGRVESLARYVPDVARQWDSLPGSGRHRDPEGTLVFVDISGFTALSERLAQRGRIGAEQLTDVLNDVFATMLGLAAARGGSLLKFGGDALLLLFIGPAHAVQAVSAAHEMRRSLAAVATRPSAVGRLRLRMSVGVHSGPVDLFLVGDSAHELVVVGPAATATAALEGLAEAGEILLSSTTAAALPPAALGPGRGDGRLLRARRALAPPVGSRPRLGPADPTLLPVALRGVLAAGTTEAEHRTIAVAFLRFSGTDAVLATDGPATLAEQLHTLVATTQRAADAHGVTLLASDLAPDGGKLILVAGFPASRDDDAGQLLLTVRTVLDAARKERWPLPVRAGIARGHVFAGAVGSQDRATVTVMGDTVNLAARIMAHAAPGELLATPAVLDAAARLFRTEPVEPFQVKGKTAPVRALRVGRLAGSRPPRTLGAMPFVGRESLRADVAARVDALDRGSGSVLLVRGETGVGKSRLAAEALAGLTPAMVQIRAEPYGMATPYRPFRDAVRRLLGLDAHAGRPLTDQLTDAVARALPDGLGRLPLVGDVTGVAVAETDETRALDPRYRPDRTADVVVELIRALRPGPLVLVVDDAHWMDSASANLLRRLERACTVHPWFLLVLTRPGADLGLAADIVTLEPLDEADATTLLQLATVAAPLRPDQLDALVARSAGNPLFLEETVKAVQHHADVEALPASLETMMAAQIDALPPLARGVVRQAAVLGRSFRTDVLRELLPEHGDSVDAATLDQLSGVLEPDGAGRYRFRHALLRDAAYDGLPFRRRQDLHLRAAAATLAHATAGADSVADGLSLHYSLGGDDAETWRWSRVAGDRARLAYANPEATLFYGRAVASAARLRTVPREEVREVYEHRALVQHRAGDYPAEAASLSAALGLAEQPVQRARLLVRRSDMQLRTGALRAALAGLTRADRLLATLPHEDGDALAVRTDAVLARAAVLVQQGKLRDAQHWAQAGIDLAERSGNRTLLASALRTRSGINVLLREGDSVADGERALALASETGDLPTAAGITSNLGVHAYYAGDWDRAEELYRAAAEIDDRTGNSVEAAVTRSNLAELLITQGREDDAVPVLRWARSALRAAGNAEGIWFAETQHARLEAHQGQVDAALARLDELLGSMPGDTSDADTVEVRLVAAEIALEAGRVAQGRATLALVRAADLDEVTLARAEALEAVALLVEGRHDEAAPVVQRAAQAAAAESLAFEVALMALCDAVLAGVGSHPPEGSASALHVDPGDDGTAALARLGIRARRIASMRATLGGRPGLSPGA
jgi:class 3 adenylate cyclase/tetratricopeptide (TPR) repeat protein